ncbi:T9SS type A sorting domain-containing protein [Bacteroides sp.]
MKRGLLFSAAMLLTAASVVAQTDITPSRYKFADQPVGPYVFDYLHLGGSNPGAADFQAVRDDFPEGCFMFGGAKVTYTSMDVAATKALQAGINIVDLGGNVGKVFCFRGKDSKYEIGNPTTETPNWFNLNFFTDPARTPLSADAGATNKIRVRIVYSAYKNTIALATSILKFYCSTAGNNVIPAGDNNDKNLVLSEDFAARDADGDLDIDENENYFYDPTRWAVYEFDTWVPEEAGAPTRLKMEFPAAGDYTIFIKELQFLTDVTGDPKKKEIVTYTPNPTSVKEVLGDSQIFYVIDGNNVTFADNAEIYAVSGAKVANATASNPITLNKGFYIAKVGQKTAKLSIK